MSAKQNLITGMDRLYGIKFKLRKDRTHENKAICVVFKYFFDRGANVGLFAAGNNGFVK